MKAVIEAIFDQATGHLSHTHPTTLNITLRISPYVRTVKNCKLQPWAEFLNWFQYFYC